MDKIPNNHLGCIWTNEQWDIYLISTGERRILSINSITSHRYVGLPGGLATHLGNLDTSEAPTLEPLIASQVKLFLRCLEGMVAG